MCSLVYSRLIPESPSWELVVGRNESAIKRLELVATVNGQPFKVQGVWGECLSSFAILCRAKISYGKTNLIKYAVKLALMCLLWLKTTVSKYFVPDISQSNVRIVFVA